MTKNDKIAVIKAELVENYAYPRKDAYTPQKKNFEVASVMKVIKLIAFAGFAIGSTDLVLSGFSKLSLGLIIISGFILMADKMLD